MDKVVTDTALSSFSSRYQRLWVASVIALVAVLLLAGGILWAHPLQGAVQSLLDGLAANRTDQPAERVDPATLPFGRPVGAAFSFRDLDNHPDRLHGAFFSSPVYTLEHAPVADELVVPFRALLNIYVMRQAVDDNFTIRVIDTRTNSLLERYTLTEERARFFVGGATDWTLIDELRSVVSGRLVAKYRRRGVPNEHIVVKWGRVDQIQDARHREAPFIEYEIKLSRMLGLSLLATEIGTVETFNDDRLVSSVGARGRYQMMPYLLRKHDIHSYALPVAGGGEVEVVDEWHPLITMEPSFIIVRAYANAVGHEIAGISAYHTGPFNLFRIYDLYLNDPDTRFTPASTVMDAYMWALTDGFDRVAEETGFRNYSRAYVPAAYGALKSTETAAIDTSLTLRIERVQLADDATLYLDALVEGLAGLGDTVDWGIVREAGTPYMRFRALNPHIDLPAGEAEDGAAVPPAGNVRLSAWHRNGPIRFFLPLGASEALQHRGMAALDSARVFRYDRDAFTIRPGDVTVWDRQYADLVEDIGHFGFTNENMTQLELLETRFAALAAEHPSYYRQIQLQIIALHRSLWQTGFWRTLATSAKLAEERVQEQVAPGEPMRLSQRMVFASGSTAP